MELWLELQSFCCCINLRTGSLLILWLSLVGCVVSFVEILPLLFLKDDPNGNSMLVRSIVTTYLVILMIFGIIPAAAGLHGIYKNKTLYLKLFFGAILVGNVSLFASALILILMWMYREEFLKDLLHELTMTYRKYEFASSTEPITASVGAIVWSVVFGIGMLNLIEWYYMSVVYNYYLKIVRREMAKIRSSE